MNLDEQTLLEIEDYIKHLEEKVGLKPETMLDVEKAINKFRTYNLQLQKQTSNSLPSKDEVVSTGFRKATNADFNFRKVCKDPDHDLYYSGWMDCYDWVLNNQH